MKSNEKALIYKDINELVSSKRVILPMTIVPIILTIIVPLGILIGANLLEVTQAPLQKWILL